MAATGSRHCGSEGELWGRGAVWGTEFNKQLGNWRFGPPTTNSYSTLDSGQFLVCVVSLAYCAGRVFQNTPVGMSIVNIRQSLSLIVSRRRVR